MDTQDAVPLAEKQEAQEPVAAPLARTSTSTGWEQGSHVEVSAIMDGSAARSAGKGVWLQWDNLVVDVAVATSANPFAKKTRKTVVHGSRGRVGPGEILAVMGPSGAGKTSLFNSLAKRGRGYHVHGSATLNGLPYAKEDLAKVAGFVFQEAVFHSHVRVEETLHFAAALKLPKSMSAAEKNQRVQVLLDAFDLRGCKDTKVGDSRVKGISGGEKKRLSIAMEVMRGESVLFLDEPTTGLDSASSLMVLKLLRSLADAGTTVTLVLHQPRQQILKYIDKFLILSNGRDVYFGDMPNMLRFFEKVEMPIPLRVNPLDYVLDVINTNEQLETLTEGDDPLGKDEASSSFAKILRGDNAMHIERQQLKQSIETEGPVLPHVDRKELARHLADEYCKSGLFEAACANDPAVMPAIQYQNQEGSTFLTRLRALLHREFVQKLRNPEVVGTQIAGGVVLGLIMGSIYYQMLPTEVFNKTAGLSFAAVMVLFLVFHLILVFPVERNIWLRDRDNGLYSAPEYYFSVVIAGLPGDFIAATLLAVILYWMFGLLNSAAAFFTWLGFYYLLICCGTALLYMGGSVAPSPSVANSFVSIILMFVMIFNGFFLVYDTIPEWYRWIADINFMRFALNVLYFNEFHNKSWNCTVGIDCQFDNGNTVLIGLGIPLDLQIWRMAVYMLIIMFIFHMLALLGVTFCYTGKHHEMRRAYRAWKYPNGDPDELDFVEVDDDQSKEATAL